MKATAVAFGLAVAAGAADAGCRLALALALDVSGSVDDGEYRLQIDGLAAALEDEDVTAALLAAPGSWVRLAVFEWSSSSYQKTLADWTEIASREDVARLADHLRAVRRTPAPEATGLGTALAHGTGLLAAQPDCWDRTLDVSGDGRNNDWPPPWRLRAAGRLGDHRINALAVASRGRGAPPPVDDAGADSDARALAAYFRARVVHGEDAFVEVAHGFEDYFRAMRRKLLREIATLPIGALDPQ